MNQQSALRRGFATVAVVLGVLLFLTGCGGGGSSTGGSTGEGNGSESGSSDSGSKGVEEAKRLVAESEEVPSSVSPPTEPVDASAARGDSFQYIPVLGAIPVAQITGEGMNEAFDLVGAKVNEIDGQGKVSVWTEGIEQAISQKMNGIVTAGISPKAVAAPLQAADKAGIPVIASFATAPGLPTPSQKALGVDALVTYSWEDMSRLMADYAIAESEGKAHVVLLESSDVETSAIAVDAAKEEFAKLCPECTVEVEDAPQTQPAERLESLVHTLVTQDQSIEYLMPVFDASALTIVPAIHSAGAAERVKVVTMGGTPAVLQLLQRNDVVVADVGANIAWSGWGVADQFFRLVNGDPVVKSENVPTRTFTASNVGELDLEGDQSTWFGSDAWKGQYEKTWGLG
jgi:ribose transport system substrate-binding protein